MDFKTMGLPASPRSNAEDTITSNMPAVPWNYEETVKEIEATIARIESGELDLADVFDQFTEAVERLRQCETFLVERQQQMDLLIETLNDESDF